MTAAATMAHDAFAGEQKGGPPLHPIERLRCYAYARAAISGFASQLRALLPSLPSLGQPKDEKKGQERKDPNEGKERKHPADAKQAEDPSVLTQVHLIRAMNRLLMDESKTRDGAMHTRRLHLLLMKELVRLVGLQNAGSLINHPVLQGAFTFFQRDNSEIFSLIPPNEGHAPTFDSFVLLGNRYLELRPTITQALVSPQAMQQLQAAPVNAQDTLPLLAAVFQEAFLMHTRSVKPTQALTTLRNWATNVANVPAPAKQLLTLLPANISLGSVLRLTDQTPLEQILAVRAVHHLVSSVLALPAGSNPFHSILLSPERFRTAYVLTMPPDELMMLRSALKEGAALAWYQCECGYRYVVRFPSIT